MEHLIALGHKKIGVIIDGLVGHVASQQFVVGCNKAADDSGFSREDILFRFTERDTMKEGREIAAEFMEQHPEITAFFCTGRLAPLGIYSAALGMGKEIPGDLSVVGAYDNPDCAAYDPPLTCTSFPEFELGCTLARSLIGIIEEKTLPPVRIGIRSELVVRDSTSKYRG